MHYSLPQITKILSITLGAAVIVGYAVFQFRGFILGPQINITDPPNGAVAQQSFITVSGIATNITDIAFNGVPISIDAAGNWSVPYVLAPGINMVELSAQDRFGRTHAIEHMMIL